MEFIEFISSWKKCTHYFCSKKFWQMRLKSLGFFSEKDLRDFWIKLSCENNEEKTQFHLFSNVGAEIMDNEHSFIEHLIARDLLEFTSKAIHNSNLPFILSKEAKQILNDALLYQLNRITRETISFEYRVYKLAFPNDNPNFPYFLNHITHSTEWLEYMMQTYPVLYNDLTCFINNYKDYITLFCDRLQTDIDEICKVFAIPQINPNSVILKPFCGDMHRQGNSTISISFSDSSGSKHSFFYKPKPLSTDCIWNSIMHNIWSLGMKRTVLLTTNIDKESYGWQKEETCENNTTYNKEFYFNQGVNIALAYFLGIQDLISDNVLVKDNTPIFFDMEMFLSPVPKNTGDFITASNIAQHYLQGVIKTGLVPCFGFQTLGHTGYDNSGLCAKNKKRKNIPNERFNVKDLLAGFDYACGFIKSNKKEIVAILEKTVKQSPNLRGRYLVRFTFNYEQLFKALYSPLCQSDTIQKHLTIENLWRGYNKNILNEAIIQDEIRQIRHGDIPIFTTTPLSLDLYDEKGDIVVKNYFESSGLDSSIKRIIDFSEKEAIIQKDVIIRALFIHGYINKPEELSAFLNTKESKNTDLITQIANFLYSLPQGIDDTKYFSYIDYIISKDNIWDQGLQRLDLFQGVLGVGIFFMAWYKFSHETKAKEIVNKIYDESIEFMQNNKNVLLDSPIVKLGIMHFPTSILYYYIMGQKIMQDEAPILSEHDLNFILDYTNELYSKDQNFDYFSGSAGLILVLIELYKIRPSKRIKQITSSLGDYLINSAYKVDENMISWKKKAFSLWGGFAHGNSSISYALFKLWEYNGEYKYFQAGIQALKYDQALFKPSKKCWHKTILEPGEIHHSWGNGSAGIALSRYLISTFYKNDIMDKEIAMANHIIKDEIKNKTYTDHSVASGLLGLLEVGNMLNSNFPLKEYLEVEFSSINLSDIRCGGWEGNPTITGLYYGYAGIGYNLLKLKFIPELPSLLWI